jgi:hypothetical protein
MNARNIIISITLGLFFIGWSTPSEGQNYSYNLKFYISERNFVDTIPIEFIDDQVYIPFTTGGKKYRMLLDTGSSHGILYRDSPIVWKQKVGCITSYDANGTPAKVDMVELPPFRIGHLSISGYKCSLLAGGIHAGYDAVLGFDLFNKGITAKIDVKDSIMVLTDKTGFFDKEGGYALRYKIPRWVPIITVHPFGTNKDEARFDTGSRRLYVMSSEVRKRISLADESFASQIEGISYGSRAIGSFGPESSSEVAFLKLEEWHWGEYPFFDYHTMTTQGISRIGAEILRYGSIVINPKRKRLFFQPFNAEGCKIGNSQTEIAFVPSGNLASVGLIWEGSRHYRNGFRQGDVILSIDGKPITSFSQFVTYPFIQGRKYKFTVHDKTGKTRIVESER